MTKMPENGVLSLNELNEFWFDFHQKKCCNFSKIFVILKEDTFCFIFLSFWDFGIQKR